METSNSVSHQENRDVCASIINDCVEIAASHSNTTSQPPSTQHAVIPDNLRHVIRKEVLSSLPIRERPSRRRKETKESAELDPPAYIIFSRDSRPQDNLNERISTRPQPAQVSDDSTFQSKYERRCELDLEDGTERHVTSFRGKSYHVLTMTLSSSESLNVFYDPPIPYRRKYSRDVAKEFEDHVRETGPTDKFGTISIVHDRNCNGIIVDGKRRLDVYKTLLGEGTLGIGDVRPKTPDDFKWYRKYLTIRVFTPTSFKPPTDSEILSLSIALNGDKIDTTTLSDADVYIMLQNYMLHVYGPHQRPVSFYHNKVPELTTKAISAKLVDHLLNRQTRNKVNNMGGAESSTRKRTSKSRMSAEETSLRQLYSRYIRASISFFNQKPAFNLVFNKFGFKCPLWSKELLCYDKFLEMNQTEMTVSLALMAKRYTERRRKGDFDMTPAEGKKVIDLVFDMLRVVKTVAKDREALSNADWKHFLGTRLKGHKDKHVATNPYVQSLTFFAFKWNEKTIWKKDLILKEVERDRLQWPPHRRWRGQTFELTDFDESFFRKEIITRKQFEKKRKRPSTSGTRTSKRRRVVNNLAEGSEASNEFYDTEEEEEPPVIQNRSNQTAQCRQPVQDTGNNSIVSAPHPQPYSTAGPSSAAGPSCADRTTSASTPKDIIESGEESADSAQLSSFMSFILKKAGVQTTPSIDITELLQAKSTEFIEKIIENLQKLGPSTDREDDSNDVDEEMDDVNEEMDDDDKKLSDKAKKIWDALGQRFAKEWPTDCLPEPCQGMGLWGRALPPGLVIQIKMDVRNAIFHSRQFPSSSDDAVSEKFLDMFKEMRSTELKYKGFTVCEGFLKDEGPKDWITSFLAYYMKYFTGKDASGKERRGEPCPWESIANVDSGYDEAPLKKRIGRYQLSSLSDVLYLTSSQMPLYRKKLKLEIFVGNLICYIVNSSEQQPLRFPSFGSKLLVHTPDAKAQKIHCDYPVKKGRLLEETEVKYFAIATGKKSSYLHVLPMGHMEITKRNGRASNIEPKLVEIPPFSVGLFRGDLPHGGSGAEDDIAKRGQFEFAPRIHFYIDRPQDKESLVMEPSFLFYPS